MATDAGDPEGRGVSRDARSDVHTQRGYPGRDTATVSRMPGPPTAGRPAGFKESWSLGGQASTYTTTAKQSSKVGRTRTADMPLLQPAWTYDTRVHTAS